MLISETTDTGEPIRDYVWMEGLIASAQIDNDVNTGNETISFLHRDHLLLSAPVFSAKGWLCSFNIKQRHIDHMGGMMQSFRPYALA